MEMAFLNGEMLISILLHTAQYTLSLSYWDCLSFFFPNDINKFHYTVEHISYLKRNGWSESM